MKLRDFKQKKKIEAYHVPLEVTWTGAGDMDKGKKKKQRITLQNEENIGNNIASREFSYKRKR